MATILQIEANRRNAQKSTGPRTPEGKAVSRLNALRHGLRARTVVLPGENQDDFDQLCDDLESEWQPQSRTELFYLEQMAVSQWKLARTEIAEQSVFAQLADPQKQIPMLDRIWRCQGRFERSYAAAQRELTRLKAAHAPQTGKDAADNDAPDAFRQGMVQVYKAKAGLLNFKGIDRAGADPDTAPVAPAGPAAVYR